MEMKERAAHIQAALNKLLPADFRAACKVMLANLSPKTDEDWKAEDIETLGICGWAIMPMAEIVAARGLDDFDYAMGVLAEMTKRFTSEFAVRPFLIADPERGVEIARMRQAVPCRATAGRGDELRHDKGLAPNSTLPVP